MTNRPLAAPGLNSFRCRSPYGWVMIGAADALGAMREARRSTPDPDPLDLEVWDDAAGAYVPVAW
jgi:hypothetical protein